jgi:hypothetical protein
MADYIPVGIPIIALVVNMIVQISLARSRVHRGYLQSIALGSAIGFVCLLALAGLSYRSTADSWRERMAILLVNLGSYGALAFCYFAFVNLNKTSLRIRLFRELRRSPGGLSMEQIQALYDDHKIFALRMERLLTSQHVVRRKGRYFLASYSLWFIARVIDLGRMLVMGKDRGRTRGSQAVGRRHSEGGKKAVHYFGR